MLNRLVSSVDLMELITDHPYFPPASLSAMPLAKLNSLLLDPARIVDPATVSGKTNLVTVGIVFTNSGTRISAKGGGFCVLTIGSLKSGPCLTVFLFGHAYGKYCRSCIPGKVVALLGPKLLPSSRKDNKSNQHNDYPVSFAVYETAHLQIVANARDYGTCKASVRVKQTDGSWSSNGQCKHHVDKRISDFCEQHRKQQGKNNNPNIKQQSKLNQLKATVAPITVQHQRTGIQNSTSSNRFYNNHQQTQQHQHQQLPQKQPLFDAATRNDTVIVRNPGIPMHMKKQSHQPLRNVNSNNTNNNSSALQRLKEKHKNTNNKAATSNSAPKTKRPRSPSTITANWFKDAPGNSKKKPFSLAGYATSASKKRNINTIGLGHDGSVPIPKPSRIFAEPKVAPRAVSSSTNTQSLEEKRQKVLEQQAELARLRKEVDTNNSVKSTNARTVPTKQPKNKSQGINDNSEEDPFLAAMGVVDQEKVRNAKSVFSNEIEAEEYANRRQKVLELEKLEAAKESREKNKSKDDSKKLFKRWWCKNCGQFYSSKPADCFLAGHGVTQKLDIKNEKSTEEKRTQLNNKSSEDGGLKLGSGLDWSAPPVVNRFTTTSS